MADVSRDTIAKVEKIEKLATPEMKQEIKTGKKSINAAYKQLKGENKKAADDSTDKKPKADSDRKKAQTTAEKLYLDAEEFLNFLNDKNFPADIIKDFHNIRDDFADFMEELKEYAAQTKTE